MDAFEQIVAGIFSSEGHWVQTSFKVELTSEDKARIGKNGLTRHEIDVIAYSPSKNILKMIECKSYLNSTDGVRLADVRDGENGNRYKLFSNPTLKQVVSDRLQYQLESSGQILPSAEIELCLAFGNVKNESDREGLTSLFRHNGWRLYDERWIREKLVSLANSGYKNSIAPIVSKILFGTSLSKKKRDSAKQHMNQLLNLL